MAAKTALSLIGLTPLYPMESVIRMLHNSFGSVLKIYYVIRRDYIIYIVISFFNIILLADLRIILVFIVPPLLLIYG